LQMSETRILIRLLRMYFPRNWEFVSDLSKLRDFGGGGWTPQTPSRYDTDCGQVQCLNIKPGAKYSNRKASLPNSGPRQHRTEILSERSQKQFVAQFCALLPHNCTSVPCRAVMQYCAYLHEVTAARLSCLPSGKFPLPNSVCVCVRALWARLDASFLVSSHLTLSLSLHNGTWHLASCLLLAKDAGNVLLSSDHCTLN
jgi:hypothetical protein